MQFNVGLYIELHNLQTMWVNQGMRLNLLKLNPNATLELYEVHYPVRGRADVF